VSHDADGAALLRAIIDNPEEDTPRLAYADWLDERGGGANAARAEFIRIQIAEAGKRPFPELPDALKETPREEELLDKWGATAWHAKLPKPAGITWQTQHYERGFLYHVAAGSAPSLLRAAPEVFSRVPVTWASLDKLTPATGKQLARSPVLARLRRLDKLGMNAWSAGALGPFADTPHLRNLRVAYLHRTDLGAADFCALLSNPSLTRLANFSLVDCVSAGTATVSALVRSASAPVLEEATFQLCGIGPDVAPHLCDLVRLPKLRYVQLVNNRIDDAAVIALAGVSVAKELGVSLAWNAITDRGAGALLKGEFMRSPGVRAFLRFNRITDAMKARLAAACGDRASV
jgi:uncharacterized protein (TIGR02996 family)